MSAHAEATPSHVASAGSISVPWVILAAVLFGIGWFLTALWLLYFQWIYFSGLGFLVVSGVMLFSQRAGIDHA